MNSSMQSIQNGQNEKSPEKPIESAESSGNKATVDNPILNVDNRVDALQLLERDGLTLREKQHLCKVARQDIKAAIAPWRKKQDSDDYWEKRYSQLTMAQLVRETKKVKTKAKILVGQLRRTHTTSRFAQALAEEQRILKGRINALNEELIKRKEVANGRASV